MKWDKAWINADVITSSDNGKPYGMINDAVIATDNDQLAWVGSRKAFDSLKNNRQGEIIDCAKRLITPGLIDCHTHLIYAGNRAAEFEQRLAGISYQEIAKQGGGILSTVNATRNASTDELYAVSKKRLQQFINEGVTTIEIKSGYGLDEDNEIKMLNVAKQLNTELPIDVMPTFLGAHTTPSEYKGKPDEYIDLICQQILPKIAEMKLAVAVDGFHESIAFSAQQIERVFKTAQSLGLNIKLHADQLSDNNGAQLAASFQALSADHLEYSNEESVIAMAKNKTVAVLLPGAYYYLGETQQPPVELFRKHKVPMAVASDCNPGSSPVLSILSIMNLACTQFGLTVEEVIAGVTKNAAQALGIITQYGTLEAGKQADFIIWDIKHPAELVYTLGGNPCYKRIKAGQVTAIAH